MRREPIILPEEGIKLTKYLVDIENSLIVQALERCQYNRNKAAKLLGIPRATLLNKIKQRGLAPIHEPFRAL